MLQKQTEIFLKEKNSQRIKNLYYAMFDPCAFELKKKNNLIKTYT